MKKFWSWKTRTVMKTVPAQEPETEPTQETVEERTLYLNGVIADESWFDDDITPQIFKDELNAGTGDITVWINSPGGDCVAAAQIFNMLKEYKGEVTVKIDGLAASAASVIAMAGDNVLMSPVSTMMIHNPSTIAMGNSEDFRKAMQMLDEVKESIINAYEMKSGLSRRQISNLMDSEYWMNANEALAKGFIDGILYKDESGDEIGLAPAESMGFSPVQIENSIVEKISKKCVIAKPEETENVKEDGLRADEMLSRLDLIKTLGGI